VIVVAVLFITTEFRRGLIRTSLIAMPRRGRMLAAKAVVVGAAVFAVSLPALAIILPLSAHLMRSGGNFVLPAPAITQVRMVVGSAALLALAAVLACALGALLRRGVLAVAAAILLVLLPYVLVTTSVLPAAVAPWLLRLTPAAAFAVQQALPAYAQTSVPQTATEGYYPLAPWGGLLVLAGWAFVALALAVVRIRRADA
jgi:ABC-type transport system involved in multi-copper enzyme maturation permease subunit